MFYRNLSCQWPNVKTCDFSTCMAMHFFLTIPQWTVSPYYRQGTCLLLLVPCDTLCGKYVINIHNYNWSINWDVQYNWITHCTGVKVNLWSSSKGENHSCTIFVQEVFIGLRLNVCDKQRQLWKNIYIHWLYTVSVTWHQQCPTYAKPSILIL